MDPDRILKRLILPLAGIIVLIIVVVAIASGGGDNQTEVTPISTGTTSTTALSKADFIDQADPICQEANIAIANLGTSGSDAQSATAQQLSITKSELASLEALGTSDTDAATLNDFLAALQGEIKALDQKKLALQRGDDAGAAEADTALATAQTEAETAGTAFGFKDCGQAASASTGGTGGTGGTGTTTTPATTTTPTTTTPTTTTTPVPPTGGTGGGGTGGGGGGGGSGGVGPG
jgi:hypothetical protein